ncbi:uncharacterized protein Z519_11722 [Cladophialophora bantiana CBS 173.52]|uniref:FAD-binding PCMH-type domain-containing protein n=1 Tax=Cladophialophora bantiana (strain ATCC 10958 / CBS 173.52 / CDC B-1940 / NIH 8579) TaxID=1442370 RepID=A0A0D2H347_CLAB1|nr:uncharacterized protein Z519_11722 [Cladophialophora bantiana CBS 173.52]KIW87748.1 hypothetical protein Z519_11722 [Cladophialophora bantiana CBS 173.52]
MANNLEIDHGNHQHDSVTSVTDCILGLRKKVDSNELPGFAELIDDWFDPNVEVDEEQFIRRFLHTFKQTDKDFTYEKIVGDYDDEVQEIFNDFVDGKIDAKEAGQRYSQATTDKGPRLKRDIRRGGLAGAIPGEPNILTEPINLLRAAPTSIPSRIRALFAKLFPSLKDPKRALYVPTYKNLEFLNHGRTIENTPALTCVPNTSQDVCDIIKFAKKQNMGVRASGFRHSWSPVFGRSNKKGGQNNGDILISTLGLIDASILPNLTSLPTDIFQPRAKDLNSIVVVNHTYVKGPQLTGGKKYVRVGTSTTNEQLRRWCIETGKVTMPMNIVEVEITMGGSNATICHGGGIQNPTISDLVRCMEYVDANGMLRKIDMSTPDILRAAAGCFGLIGIVTHLVLELDPLSCALMEPRKVPVIEAIPPPPGMPDSAIPPPLRPKHPLSAERKAEIQRDFETRATTTDYAEWFWFPYSSEAWVNTWHKTLDTSNAVKYPSDTKTILQVFGTFAVQIAQDATILLKLTEAHPETQTKLLTWVAMKNLDDIGPNGKIIKTWVPDALHFQRGVQNLRVRDLEVEFPLQPKVKSDANGPAGGTVNGHVNGEVNGAANGTVSAALATKTKDIDLTLVQQAWWDAILSCYAAIKTCPQRMPLEMRIMAGSQVTLAPQRGHTLGTCAIEILSLHNVADIWPAYAQKVLNKWTSYKDHEGKSVPVRAHWAKEWYGYTVGGRRWEEIFKEEQSQNGGFKDAIAEWRTSVGQLAMKHGWKTEDARMRFGNEVLDWLFWQDGTAKQAAPNGVVVNAAKEKKPGLGKRMLKSCFGK